MGQKQKEPLSIEQFSENLATFAINRDDLKMLLNSLPENSGLNVTAVEYELQILKIISIGWAISFYMTDSNNKQAVTTRFWENIREISQNISTLTQTTTGTGIDYFSILRERLDVYIKAMKENSREITNPSSIMGPVFADACNSTDNAVAILLGTKMFTLCLGSVKEYIDAVEIQ